MPRKRDWQLRIKDILEAVENILAYTKDIHQGTFESDRMRIHAVCHNFGIIGEAATQVPADIIAANPHLPWSDMRAMRNFVIHVYFGVNPEKLWKTIRTDLPPLVSPLKAILAAAT